ncbi:AMP-binding protein [Enterovirga rhinocerotis]|uniref:3-methylmercaptopropionyl-CoA ligase n=1 Tax=Enterovirga rhinocerotis TaxID=1339210 RepID=A0A4R7BY44_9HYPH|nr:AMP-binding protein [Enterovirga rhinocerotis]TDR90463.1 fatty-acyl-CoA synthase [Enterovirga rhinocerotis]
MTSFSQTSDGAASAVSASFLDPRAANHVALTPLDFLRRSAEVYPDKIAVVLGDRRLTYRDFHRRAASLAGALRSLGVVPGETVAVLAPNVPVMLEAHFGVPAAGAVLNALNTRLDAPSMAFMLDHGEARVLIVHHSLLPVALDALAATRRPPILVVEGADEAPPAGALAYEDLLRSSPGPVWSPPPEEWTSIALNYTSGTTGDPKGVLYHHRGAYLNALGNVITFNLQPDSVYLWTLPMFHCNGWTYPWAVTSVGARHICLPAIDPAEIFRLIDEEKVTHLCAAPVVLTMLIHAPREVQRRFTHGRVRVATGGAAPPSAVIAGMEELGFDLVHLYGMTECYGPSTACAPQEGWSDLPLDERSVLTARQGVRNLTVSDQSVIDPDTDREVPADGATLGELVLRGNTVMKGYLKNEAATEATLRGGWLRTGDLAVLHPDRYVEIKDRSKDIIISGGENISSLEVEEVLFRHPAVMEAAVVARPDEKWGETPCAFVTLKPGVEPPSGEEIIAFCRAGLAHFKAPKTVIFGALPKTSTGKIMKTELRARAAELAS